MRNVNQKAPMAVLGRRLWRVSYAASGGPAVIEPARLDQNRGDSVPVDEHGAFGPPAVASGGCAAACPESTNHRSPDRIAKLMRMRMTMLVGRMNIDRPFLCGTQIYPP